MTKPERWIMAAVIVFVASVIISAYYIKNNAHSHCGKIVSVGGCDNEGYCGVILVSGATGAAKYPVAGQNICVRCRQDHD